MKKIKVGIKNNPYEVNVGSDLLNKKNLKDLKSFLMSMTELLRKKRKNNGKSKI